MISTFNTFVEDIGSIEYNIPYYYKSAFIILLIIIASVGLYIYNDFFSKGPFRDSYMWFFAMMIFNLVNILLIITYYNYKKETPGSPGKVGKVGKRGTYGKAGNCGYCTYTLFFQKTKRYNTLNKLFKRDNNNLKQITYGKYKDLINNEDVNYQSFIMDIILGDGIVERNINRNHLEFSRLISNIMYQKQLILGLFVYYFNKNLSKISNVYSGSFMRPYGKAGYYILGDVVIGAIENIKLNAFLIAPSNSEESLHPIRYDKLVTYNALNKDTDRMEEYSIWRPIGQTINGMDDLGNPKEQKYMALGDVISEGTEPPNINLVATIHEKCLKPISDDNLRLVFIHIDTSSIQFTNTGFGSNRASQYSNLTREFQLDQPSVVLQMFSVWRTPLNTFLTNYINNSFKFTNNSVIYNIIGGRPDKIDEYNNVLLEEKRKIIKRLRATRLNQLQNVFILVNHYSYKYINELKYYLHKSDSQYVSSNTTSQRSISDRDKRFSSESNKKNISYDEGIEGASDLADSATTIKQMTDFIKQKGEEFEEFNKERARRIFKDPDGAHGRMKRVPNYLLKIYNKVITELNQIENKIYNIENMYDLVTEIFENGIETRIAINNEGIAEGGKLLDYSQEIVMYLCKIISPPDYQSYMIKSDCIGHNVIDTGKKNLELKIEEEISKFNRFVKKYRGNPNKYCTSWESVLQFQELTYNTIGEHVGHIDNYVDKIERLEFNDFTESRLKVILEQYKKLNSFVEGNCNK